MARSVTITRALTRALSDAQLSTRDGAGVALVRRYARLIDEAQPASVYAEALRVLAEALPDGDEEARRALRRITDALSAHSVASDLGPKLLAGLAALGMTPVARSVKGGVSSDAVRGALDELRERRARRGTG